MAQNQGDREERKLDFTPEGEVRGYIGLDQARVQAMEYARDNTEFYGPEYAGATFFRELIGATESDDHYDIRLSFRVSGQPQGRPGIEQFIFDKTGELRFRQLLEEPGTHQPPRTSGSPKRGLPMLLAIGVILAAGAAWVWFSNGIPTQPPPPPPTIDISMASSITKWEWLEDAVEAFNATSASDSKFQINGKSVQVEVLLEKDPLTGKLRHWNSPTQVFATLRGEIEPTILSPAATTWILKLNKEWSDLYGRDITSNSQPPSLLSTPVVIAMWESRAEALGCWPDAGPECTRKSIRDLAVSPDGWGMLGHPEWGIFHFGYAYVGESDVGTQTAVLLCMMGSQKTVLDVGDVESDNGCGRAIADVEEVIVHRGTSSPLILQAMRSGGSAFLDAVTTYEKNVIGFNWADPDNQQEPLVSVYPQDGTVVADHTFAVMDRAPWVTEEQVKAAELFKEFLFSPEQQELLLGYGLRPFDVSVTLGPPIDGANGANPSAKLVKLDSPKVLVIDRVVEVWKEVKKPANVVLVFDKSGSMQEEKIVQARSGAIKFVDEMDPKDWLFWLPFENQIFPGARGLKSEIGEQLQNEIRSTTARGGTALYDAIAHGYQVLRERRESQGDAARYGIVVLSDGKDESSETTLAKLDAMLRPTEGDPGGIQSHIIGIGEDADDLVLTKIARFTDGGRYWKVTDPATTEAVYRPISKYW